MAARVIDGRVLANQIDEETLSMLRKAAIQGARPSLAVITVGSDAASYSYSIQKEKVASRLNIGYRNIVKDENSEEDEIIATVDELAADSQVDGVLVHTPLPPRLDERRVLDRIPQMKDVDCASTYNMGRLYSGRPLHPPATAQAVVEILVRSGFSPAGKHVVVLGRSLVVGKPLANLLIMKSQGGDATVTVCHSRTVDVRAFTRRADILVSAIGRPAYLTKDMVNPGTVVVDVGINSIPDPSTKSGYRIVGDVDYEGVSEVASAITPVPGGVGPVTTSVLMKNVARAHLARTDLLHN